MNLLIQIAYLVAAGLFIVGLRRMSSPATTRDSLVWVGSGMALAIVVTLLWPGMQNRLLILIAIAIGSILAWASGRTVAMTRMPQMIALYNGLGGGAVGAIAALEMLKPATGHGALILGLAALSGVVGMMSFSGSLVAFGNSKAWSRVAARLVGSNRTRSTWRRPVHWLYWGFSSCLAMPQAH